MKPGWFGPKRVGIGFSPRSWQGWVVTVILIAVLAAALYWIRPAISEEWDLSMPLSSGLVVVVWLALFSGIAALTYDGSKD